MLLTTFGIICWKFRPKFYKFEQVGLTVESIDVAQNLVVYCGLCGLLNHRRLRFVIIDRIVGRLLDWIGYYLLGGAFLHNFAGFVVT